jgi:hypothetical protein
MTAGTTALWPIPAKAGALPLVQHAAHGADGGTSLRSCFPRLPVRQWVLSVPRRLRYFMQRDGAALNVVLRIFQRVIAQSLQDHCAGAAQVDKAALHIGAVAFIHRFGSSLNAHVHLHVCAVDSVFEKVAVAREAAIQSSSLGVVFHPASAIDETTVAQVKTDLPRRILRAFVGRGLIKKADAKEMLAYQHSGFSVDPGVCIDPYDRAALEPPPRTHRHRNFGVLAPNSPHRAAVTAFAAPMQQATAEPAQPGTGVGVPAPAPEPEAPPKRSKAHYLCAVLIARIYEVFPLLCPKCGGQMRLIAFITEGTQIR